MTGFLLLFARIPVLVLALVTGLGAVGSSALTVQAYTAAQQASQSQFAAAEAEILARIDASVKQQATLELAITNAKALLDSSRGKTLDNTARADLTAAITDAQLQLQQATAQVLAAQANLRQHQAEMAGFVLPWTVAAVAQDITSAPVATDNELALIISGVGDKMKAVNDAQIAWQAEQDRIALEAARAAAARAAAARAAAERAAAQNQIVTPPASVPITQPTITGFNPESYLLALAPNAFVTWVDGLCAAGTICGEALVGGYKNTPVQIKLDAGLRSSYGSDPGKYVLTHEAAHARQWWTYVGNIIPISEQQSGLTGAPAVEYMADCATFGKLGSNRYWHYTQNCTAAQFTAIAPIWR